MKKNPTVNSAVFLLAAALQLEGCFAFGPPEGFECTQGSDCDDGHVCVEGECMKVCTLQLHCGSDMFCSPDGVCVEKTDPPPTPTISAPTQLSAQGGDQQVSLTWEPVSGAVAYNLYWALGSGVALDSNRVSDVVSPFVHTPLVNNTTYYYALTAVDDVSESALSNEVSATTLIDVGTKLAAPAAQPGDWFGYSVALSGEFAIVGARRKDAAAGVAYVFHHDGSGWDTGTKLVAPDAQTGDEFGFSVALSGEYAIVGAHGEDGGEGDLLDGAGAAYVFHHTGSSWDTGTKLVAPGAQAGDEFGCSVALSGDFAVVGAFWQDNAGAAYVFQRTGPNSWDLGTKLVAPDAQAFDGFGFSVALGGEHAIVGANGEDGGETDPLDSAGAAYVYYYDGSTWDTGTKLVGPDAQANDNFGCSVGLASGYAIVGADMEDGGESEPLSDAGAAYLYKRTGPNSWSSGVKLVAPYAEAGDRFGGSVALTNDYAIVGADSEDGSAGAAYLYGRTGPNSWDSGAKLVAPDAQSGDSFGYSVALSSDYAIVGAHSEDGGDGDGSTDAGAAYVYEY